MVLSGASWDGVRCNELGSGCGCVGADCGTVFADLASCQAATAACTPVAEECRRQEAIAHGACGAYFTQVRWNGRGCVELGGGCGCEGADCQGLYADKDACERDHAACPR
jgi:hypothetical protein